jgi:hypothetical protein
VIDKFDRLAAKAGGQSIMFRCKFAAWTPDYLDRLLHEMMR